jgi:hypothetical protein
VTRASDERRLAWRRFGLAPDDGVREVRARYAALLRHNRPDSDPVAFEQLRADYELCLAFARARARGPVGTPEPSAVDAASVDDAAAVHRTGPAESVPPLTDAPARPAAWAAIEEAPPATGPSRSWDALAVLALSEPDAAALGRFLVGTAELQALAARDPMERAIVERLADGAQARTDVLARLAEWFGWDEVMAAQRPGSAQASNPARFAAAMRRREQLAAAQALEVGPYASASPGRVAVERRFLHRLSKPRPAWRIWVDAIVPGIDRESAARILDHWAARLGLHALDSVLDRDHVEIWMQATTPFGNRHSTAVGLLRTMLISMVVGLLALLLTGAHLGSSLRDALSSAALPAGVTLAIGGSLIVAINLAAYWLAVGRHRAHLEWQRRVHGSARQRNLLWAAVVAAPILYYGIGRVLDLQGTLTLVAFGLSIAYLGLGGVVIGLAGTFTFAGFCESTLGDAIGFPLLAGICCTMLVFVASEFLVAYVIPRWRPSLQRSRPLVVVTAGLLALPFVVAQAAWS